MVLLGLIGDAPFSFAVAATLYVDKGNAQCTDSGPGTAPTPFCTIGKGAAVAVAGDTVSVASGTYSEQVTPPRSGSSGAPILYTASPGANVTVGGQANGFRISSRSWMTVQKFTVSDTTSHGIYVDSSTNITLADNHVMRAGQPEEGLNKKGIYLSNTVDSLVSGNTVEFNTDSGILLTNETKGVQVIGNIAHNNARGYIRAAPGIDVRSGDSAGGNTIKGNISYDNEDSGIQLYQGASNNLVVNNLCFRGGDHGIDVSSSPGNTVVGNSVYGTVTAGINVEGNATNTLLANNLSVDNGIDSPRTRGNLRVDSTSTSGTTLDYDQLFLSQAGQVMVVWGGGGTSYSSLSSFVAATGKEPHGLAADPRWVAPALGDFHLMTGSPAIDSASSAASGASDKDLESNPRVDDPATPNTGVGPRTYDDRGAYELQPAAGDTTPPSVAIMLPAAGATVSGAAVTVAATASDNVGVAGVQFKLDGANLGAEDTTPPYSVTWNSTTATNASHTLTALARDAAGNTTTSAVVFVSVDNNDPPVASVVGITGTPQVGQVLTSSYDYADAEGDLQSASTFRWLRDGTTVIATTQNYTLIAADQGTMVSFEVTPVAQSGTSPGIVVVSAAVGPVAAARNDPPVASNVLITGTAQVGQVLTSSYDYADAEGDLQSASTFRWLRDGTTVIATTQNYTLIAADQGTMVSFEVTPVAQSGTSPGIAVVSAAVGPVAAPPNDPPTVSLIAPANGATASGTTVTVSATAADDVGVAGVQFKLDDANLGLEDTTAPYSVTWDTTTVGDGVHALTAVARDAATNTTTSIPVSVTVSNAVTLTFTPAADATIKPGSPTTNFGSATKLEIDKSPIEHFLMKFTVSGIGARQVTNAKLRLFNTNASDRGGDFHRVGTNAWMESTVTWNNAPVADTAVLASLGAVAINSWVEVNITSLITGDATYSMRVDSTSSSGADYWSREKAGFVPQLVITVQ